MSNIATAIAAIRAEIEQAKQGLAYYQSQVAALERAQTQLTSLAADAAPAPKKRGRKPRSEAAVESEAPAAGKKRGPNKGARKELPSTGGDFWLNQVSAEPRTAPEILDGAIINLRVTPTPAQRKKLQQRMVFALNSLVKEKKIRDSGMLRERRYFK